MSIQIPDRASVFISHKMHEKYDTGKNFLHDYFYSSFPPYEDDNKYYMSDINNHNLSTYFFISKKLQVIVTSQYVSISWRSSDKCIFTRNNSKRGEYETLISANMYSANEMRISSNFMPYIPKIFRNINFMSSRLHKSNSDCISYNVLIAHLINKQYLNYKDKLWFCKSNLFKNKIC